MKVEALKEKRLEIRCLFLALCPQDAPLAEDLMRRETQVWTEGTFDRGIRAAKKTLEVNMKVITPEVIDDRSYGCEDIEREFRETRWQRPEWRASAELCLIKARAVEGTPLCENQLEHAVADFQTLSELNQAVLLIGAMREHGMNADLFCYAKPQDRVFVVGGTERWHVSPVREVREELPVACVRAARMAEKFIDTERLSLAVPYEQVGEGKLVKSAIKSAFETTGRKAGQAFKVISVTAVTAVATAVVVSGQIVAAPVAALAAIDPVLVAPLKGERQKGRSQILYIRLAQWL